jgi:hypothetical protein
MTRLNPQTTPRHELRAEKARRNREAALNAFIGKKAEIDEMLARLQALSDDHFNAHPDEVNWAMSFVTLNAPLARSILLTQDRSSSSNTTRAS